MNYMDLCNLSNIYAQDDDLHKALFFYCHAWEVWRKSGNTNREHGFSIAYNIGMTLYKMKKYLRAIQAFDIALNLIPEEKEVIQLTEECRFLATMEFCNN